MRFLIFDIETIPQPDLDEGREAEVARKTELEEARGVRDHDEAESLIRSVSPFFGRVLAIGMRLFNTDDDEVKDKVICEADERATLETFFETINHPASQDLRFVHYNGLGFDIPFLLIRAAHHDLPITNRKFIDLRRFRFDPQIDLMQFLAHWSMRDTVSLDIACRSFGIPSPKEGEVKGNSVAQAFNDGNLSAVEDYVMRDVEATYQLFLKLRNYI